MSKNTANVMDKGSTAKVNSAINQLATEGTVKVTGTIFTRVLNSLRTTCSDLIENKSISVDYGNCQITLN